MFQGKTLLNKSTLDGLQKNKQKTVVSLQKKASYCPLTQRLTVAQPFSLGGVAGSDSLLTWKRRRSMGRYGSAAGGGGLPRRRCDQTCVSCFGGYGFKTLGLCERNSNRHDSCELITNNFLECTNKVVGVRRGSSGREDFLLVMLLMICCYFVNTQWLNVSDNHFQRFRLA